MFQPFLSHLSLLGTLSGLIEEAVIAENIVLFQILHFTVNQELEAELRPSVVHPPTPNPHISDEEKNQYVNQQVLFH